jgi:outer membrane protein assembly factor BamB
MRQKRLHLLELLCVLALAGCTQPASVPSGAPPTPIVLHTPLPTATPIPPAPSPTLAPAAPPSVYLALSDQTFAAEDASTGLVRWRFRGESAHALALVNNILYMGGQSTLFALTALDGIMRWSDPTPGAIRGLVVQNNIVYAAAESGIVLAANAGDGVIRWFSQAEVPANTLAIAGDRLYASSSGGTLIALDLNGRLVWSQASGHLAYSDLVTANDLLYVVINETNLSPTTAHLAAYSRDGQPLWNVQPSGEAVLAAPVVSPEGVVYTADSGYVYAYDAIKGIPRWQAPAGQGVYYGGVQSLALAGSMLLLGTVSYAAPISSLVIAYSAELGKPFWLTVLGTERPMPDITCQALGSMLLVEAAGRLYALNSSNGNILWKNDLDQAAELPFIAG